MGVNSWRTPPHHHHHPPILLPSSVSLLLPLLSDGEVNNEKSRAILIIVCCCLIFWDFFFFLFFFLIFYCDYLVIRLFFLGFRCHGSVLAFTHFPHSIPPPPPPPPEVFDISWDAWRIIPTDWNPSYWDSWGCFHGDCFSFLRLDRKINPSHSNDSNLISCDYSAPISIIQVSSRFSQILPDSSHFYPRFFQFLSQILPDSSRFFQILSISLPDSFRFIFEILGWIQIGDCLELLPWFLGCDSTWRDSFRFGTRKDSFAIHWCSCGASSDLPLRLFNKKIKTDPCLSIFCLCLL